MASLSVGSLGAGAGRAASGSRTVVSSRPLLAEAAEAVDSRPGVRRRGRCADHVWVLQRPWSLNSDEKSKNPEAECCSAPPPVMEFDAAGNYLRGWGGQPADDSYEWPMDEHGIHVDHKGNVWVSSAGGPRMNEGKENFLAEVHAGRQVPAADRPPRHEQGQPRHRATSTTPPTCGCIRRPTRCSSPTATSTAASSCSTPTPARSSGCGARTATRRTTRRRRSSSVRDRARRSSTPCTASRCRPTASST